MANKEEIALKQTIAANKSIDKVTAAKIDLRKLRRQKEQAKYDCAEGITTLLKGKNCKMVGKIMVDGNLLMKIQIAMCRQGAEMIPITFAAEDIEIENIE